MLAKHFWVGLGFFVLAGCHTRVRPEVDGLVCTSVNRPVDYLPDEATTRLAGNSKSAHPDKTNPVYDNLLLTSAQQPTGKDEAPVPKATTLETRLQVPSAMPGAAVAPIKLPNPKAVTPEEYKAAVRKYFPPLPPIGPDPVAVPGPEGRPMTLAELQALGRANSPLLRQAAADVSAAKGAAIQAGAYPNPIAGVLGTTHGPSGGPTYGVLLGQTIKTMGKLKLAQAAAIMDLENAQTAYHRTETDLMASIRSGYFAVLVAQESIKANRALVNLTDEVYKVNVEQAGGGEAAPYEPMQVAVFAGQARQGLIIARNSYTLAWKQLAANLGVRGMPATQLEGRIDMPLPIYEYDKVLAQVLTNHTEVATAVVGEQKARYNLRLAEVTAIPDVTVQTTIANDNSLGASSSRIIAGVQATVPVPVWDLNLGAIQQSRGALMHAVEEQHRVRDSLTSRVADAYRRYAENRDLLELYRVEILPKQVQAFRAAVARHYGGEIGRVAYTDLIQSEQNLVSVIGPYILALGSQWQAVVDVANLLQTEDLFQTNGVFPVAPVPNLEELLQLPCCHPCSSLPGSTVPGADHTWPAAGFQAAPPQPAPGPAPKNEARRLPSHLPPVTERENKAAPMPQADIVDLPEIPTVSLLERGPPLPDGLSQTATELRTTSVPGQDRMEIPRIEIISRRPRLGVPQLVEGNVATK
jgi:cobalt-zinc-cadmium efflux system outer membrane protein